MRGSRFSASLASFVLCALAMLSDPSQAHAAGEVSLELAQLNLLPMNPGGNCPACYRLEGVVEIKNLSYTKQVDILYSTGGAWLTAAATYLGPAEGGFEAWQFAVDTGYLPSEPSIQFAVRYRANGQTYYDSNGSKNYTVTPTTPIFPHTEVLLVSAEKGGGLGCYGLCADLTAKVRVANLAYAKTVSLWYSLNGGGSWTQANGQFERTLADGYEQWRVYISYIFPRETSVLFAVKYQVNGRTYWDNHYGTNYVR